MTAFDKHQVAVFRFVRCAFAADTGVAQLVYAFDDGPELIETVTIPGAPFVLEGDRVVHEERLFAELGRRIRDVRQGPDGHLWLVDETEGRILRLDPA